MSTLNKKNLNIRLKKTMKNVYFHAFSDLGRLNVLKELNEEFDLGWKFEKREDGQLAIISPE